MDKIPNAEPMEPVLLTAKEQQVIDTIRKVLWGSVEVVIKRGRLITIKKVVETFNLDER